MSINPINITKKAKVLLKETGIALAAEKRAGLIEKAVSYDVVTLLNPKGKKLSICTYRNDEGKAVCKRIGQQGTNNHSSI